VQHERLLHRALEAEVELLKRLFGAEAGVLDPRFAAVRVAGGDFRLQQRLGEALVAPLLSAGALPAWAAPAPRPGPSACGRGGGLDNEFGAKPYAVDPVCGTIRELGDFRWAASPDAISRDRQVVLVSATGGVELDDDARVEIVPSSGGRGRVVARAAPASRVGAAMGARLDD
jgi:hypothetical protein